MNVFKLLKDYYNDENGHGSFNRCLDDCDNIFETIAFAFLCFCSYLLLGVVGLVLFVTVPVWIVPYVVVKSICDSKKGE